MQPPAAGFAKRGEVVVAQQTLQRFGHRPLVEAEAGSGASCRGAEKIGACGLIEGVSGSAVVAE